VFYFFRNAQCNIVGFFLFSQLMVLLANIIPILIARYQYRYDFRLILKSFKFSREIFKKTKNLAFATLCSTIGWIIYYELDPLVIAKIFGAEKLAFYAIGLTLSSYLRGMCGCIYAPFLARFSHFIGLQEDDALRNFYQRVIIVMAPIILPIISIIFLMKPLIYCWVGRNYELSVAIAQFLVGIFIFGFISYPASLMVMAQERVKLLVIISSILPAFYWGGVLLFIPILQVKTFAYIKFFVYLISVVIYINFTLKFLKINIRYFFKRFLSPIIFPVISVISLSIYLNPFMPLKQGRVNLSIVIAAISISSFLGLCLYYGFSAPLRNYVNNSFLRKLV
jgi:O-antigen/teichoic acid export membrane protein